MPRRAYDRFCPLSLALEEVGDRWTLHIVYTLLSGPKRYADLKLFLDGAGSNVLGDRLRRLADAHLVTRQAGARPGSETTYQLTQRGRALAPVIKSLVEWGLPLLTQPPQASPMTTANGEPHEAFDQTWAITNPALLQDEVYQWTVDGVDTELVVSGHALLRKPGPAHAPVVTMVTTSRVLTALAAGELSASQALASGQLSLSGPAEAVRRMLMVTALPAR
jgi:DNA-binding HxlR family transcriptional regulator